MNNRINELVELIKHAANFYYNTDAPIISDEEFDILVEELRSLDSHHPILTTPGWGSELSEDISSHRDKFKHTFLVEGLDKIQSISFDPNNIFRTNADHYVQSSKLDGLSGVAYYGDVKPNTGMRKLKYVLTRNNGEVGLDVTASLKYCKIPEEVPANIEWVRGEIVTTWDAAAKYEYSHPRNMACGLANSVELSEAHQELHFVAYNSSEQTHQSSKLLNLGELGFEVVRWHTLRADNEYNIVKPYYDYSREDYIKYDYPVDGSVLTHNSLGNSFAVKYPTPIVEVKVTKIVNQVSSRGRVIPVIGFEPVFLAGAELTYCSGFNYEQIKANGIGPGAIIKITRANEVIPHWVSTVTPVTPDIPSEIDGMPTIWRGCHLEVVMDKTADCIRTLIGWRAPLGIGYVKQQLLIEKYQINTLRDLACLAFCTANVGGAIYEEHIQELKNIFGATFSDRVIDMLKEINKGYTLSELLQATYSRSLGHEAGSRLMKKFENTPLFLFNHLIENNGLSKEADKEMPSYLVAEGIVENIELVKAVLTAGFNIIEPEPEKVISADAIPIALTGKLSKPRSALIEEWGSKVVEVDVAKAKYLVTDNPASGSAKNQAAAKLGVTLINEADFRKIIGA